MPPRHSAGAYTSVHLESLDLLPDPMDRRNWSSLPMEEVSRLLSIERNWLGVASKSTEVGKVKRTL